MQPANMFESIPEDLSKEQFQEILQSEHLRIERIISHGHSSPEDGWYDQEQGEWVILLKGSAELLFEDAGEIRLKPGDHINIPAHTRHRVNWTEPDTETIWLAVHYD